MVHVLAFLTFQLHFTVCITCYHMAEVPHAITAQAAPLASKQCEIWLKGNKER